MKRNSKPNIDAITVEELNKILAEKDEEARRIVDRVFGPKQSPADIVDEFLKNKRTRRTKTAASLWAEDSPSPERKKPGHEESQLQQLCVAWFRSTFPAIAPLLIAVPNAARRNARTGAILKREGLTAGVADLILLVGRGEFHSLCIEMKTRRKGSGQSDKQIEWEQVATANGNEYVVCRDLEEFKITVLNYLSP